MTLRRLHILISALPPDAFVWAAIRAAEEKANTPTVDELRARQAYYEQRAKEAT